MIRSLLKLVVAILFANALWHVSSAYISHYRFDDAVSDLATHAGARSDEQLKDRVVELAVQHDEPLDAESIAIRREEHHTYISGAYTKPVAVLPGYELRWPFTLKVDGFVIVPPKLGDLTNPQ